MESLKNNLHPLENLGTETILSNVHPMAIQCDLVWTGHNRIYVTVLNVNEVVKIIDIPSRQF